MRSALIVDTSVIVKWLSEENEDLLQQASLRFLFMQKRGGFPFPRLNFQDTKSATPF